MTTESREHPSVGIGMRGSKEYLQWGWRRGGAGLGGGSTLHWGWGDGGKRCRLWVLGRSSHVRHGALLAGSSRNRVYKSEVSARM